MGGLLVRSKGVSLHEALSLRELHRLPRAPHDQAGRSERGVVKSRCSVARKGDAVVSGKRKGRRIRIERFGIVKADIFGPVQDVQFCLLCEGYEPIATLALIDQSPFDPELELRLALERLRKIWRERLRERRHGTRVFCDCCKAHVSPLAFDSLYGVCDMCAVEHSLEAWPCDHGRSKMVEIRNISW